MASTDQPVGEPGTTDKEYMDIINSDVDINRKFINDTGLPTKIVYYCKDCAKLVTPKRVGKKFKFSCTLCKGKNISFGPEASIRKYYKLPKAEDIEPPVKEVESKEKEKD